MKHRALCYLIFIILFWSCTQKKIEGDFKSWQFSDKSVVGNILLENTNGIDFFRITQLDKETTRIEEINSNGVLEQTIMVKFIGGIISSISYTNRHGKVYCTRTFVREGDGLFEESVTDGEKDYLPCKGIRHVLKEGLIIESSFVGFDGKMCTCAEGYSIERFVRYDDDNLWGEIKEKSYFDEKGMPVMSEGYHKVKFQRDERGNVLSETYWGDYNNPVRNMHGAHEVKRKFDSLDNQIEFALLGLSGEQVAAPNGISKWQYKYQDGNLIEDIRYNAQNQLAEEGGKSFSDGAAMVRYKYNEKGEEISRTYFDRDDNPIESNYGYHERRCHYDKDGNISELAYFGVRGQAKTDVDGIHLYYYSYDELGRVISLAYYDVNNKPKMDPTDQVYMEKYSYNQKGLIQSRSFWRDSNIKMTRWSGIHEYRIIYNDLGQEVESIALDEFGNLKLETDGRSRRVTEYDNYARVSRVSYFNGKEPALINTPAQISNYHSILYRFDEAGNCVMLEYSGIDGRPINAFINDTERVGRIEIEYSGNEVVRQLWFLASATIPNKFVDCTSQECMGLTGTGLYFLNK